MTTVLPETRCVSNQTKMNMFTLSYIYKTKTGSNILRIPIR